MRIAGVDPGYAIVGWGVVDYEAGRFRVVDYGAVTTPAHTYFPDRLEKIYDDISALFARYSPQVTSCMPRLKP